MEAVTDGYVVHHQARDRVHYLNHTAALVLELCTGANSPAFIAATVQRTFDLPRPPAEDVDTCLAQLRDEGLVC
jgi:hypothetical protein